MEGELKIDVHIGKVNRAHKNWRDVLTDDEPDDDDPDRSATPDVIAMLGFDPDKEEWSDNED